MPCNGPMHDVPATLSSMNPVQAMGRDSRRRVWPVGAVSNTTWSKSSRITGLPMSLANSSKAAISTVQAPASCSSMAVMAASGSTPR